ncbi:MAG: YggS family pyridoxal phosphate-dependent enzyme [Candidatus Hydrogenedentes bacterium]|nr:YggS family pyridoxal phosphate-dependent enzyme [Candidatus Hydrogenedentota bacterium]
MPSIVENIKTNISKIFENIEKAKAKSIFPDRTVRIVAITKNASVDAIKVVYDLGLRHFGENRIESILEKSRSFSSDILWHMVGTIQRRKIPDILSVCSFVDSVDRIEVGETLNKRAKEKGLDKLPVLIQVNVSGEITKHGFSIEQLDEAFDNMRCLSNLYVRGFMTIAPLNANEIELRKIFGTLRELGERYNLRELSMGMSDDYEIAVEEGATEVRLGRAIFG